MNKVEYLDLLKDYLLKAYSEEESLEILTDYKEYSDSTDTIRENLLKIHEQHLCNRCLTRERSEVEPLYEHVLSPRWIKEAMLVRKS